MGKTLLNMSKNLKILGKNIPDLEISDRIMDTFCDFKVVEEVDNYVWVEGICTDCEFLNGRFKEDGFILESLSHRDKMYCNVRGLMPKNKLSDFVSENKLNRQADMFYWKTSNAR